LLAGLPKALLGVQQQALLEQSQECTNIHDLATIHREQHPVISSSTSYNERSAALLLAAVDRTTQTLLQLSTLNKTFHKNEGNPKGNPAQK
jgi:hypothetical protein